LPQAVMIKIANSRIRAIINPLGFLFCIICTSGFVLRQSDGLDSIGCVLL